MREEQSIPAFEFQILNATSNNNNDKHKSFYIWKKQYENLTQLFVMLAKIIAHVAIFENRRRRGGSLPLVEGASDFPAWINRNSDLLIELHCRGSFVTPYAQNVSQSIPREEKRINGPEIPIEVISKGAITSPTTFPRWNPPIDIPTAVARSWFGNHL